MICTLELCLSICLLKEVLVIQYVKSTVINVCFFAFLLVTFFYCNRSWSSNGIWSFLESDKYYSAKHLFAYLLFSIWLSLSKAVNLFQKGMEVAFGKRFLKRVFSIVIFLGCAIFVAYRQRLSKIGFEILDSI